MLTSIIDDTLALGLTTPPTVAVVDQPAIVIPATPAIDSAMEGTLAERDAQARAAATAAGGVLSNVIAHGQRQAQHTINRILTEIPTDALVPNQKMAWGIAAKADGGNDVTLTVADAFDGRSLRMHRHALGQVAEKYAVPVKYIDRLASGAQWERDVLRHTLAQHAENKPARYLVRTYGGQVRGVLSDAYRPIDNRPMLDALLGALNETGFVVYSGMASDVRVSVRALKPQIFEVAGEPVVFGLEWDNSDYGASKHEVRVFLLRALCLNGMTGESLMSNTHLGKRADADVKLRKSTREAEEAYFTGLIHDTVISKAGPAAIEKTMAAVKAATEERITLGDSLPAALRRGLSKPEQDRARELFDSSESVMLPAAPTRARLANVLSWMANTVSNTDRAMDLQAMAGEVMGI
jgi:hypothetical protein